MKEFMVGVLVVLVTAVTAFLVVKTDAVISSRRHSHPVTYDPNDPIYRYVPEADKTWVDLFGASDRTRLWHAISEIRVVTANQGRLLEKLKAEVFPDPNEVSPDG